MGEIFASVFIYILLLPICLVCGTPIILVYSAFRKGSYGANVRAWYSTVFRIWDKIISNWER